MRQAPLALPFIFCAPVALGYTLGGMAQASSQEIFCGDLDDRTAFARALANAADREPGWLGADVFGERRIQTWSTRLTSHGQAGTLAPRKEELETFVRSQEEEREASLQGDVRQKVDGDVGVTGTESVKDLAPIVSPPAKRSWWKPW